jgi:hypothetical protein
MFLVPGDGILKVYRGVRGRLPMYCVFCGKADVLACGRCGRWVCPRHQQTWRSQTVCVGCGRKLVRIGFVQIAVTAVAMAMIALTVFWAIKR